MEPFHGRHFDFSKLVSTGVNNNTNDGITLFSVPVGHVSERACTRADRHMGIYPGREGLTKDTMVLHYGKCSNTQFWSLTHIKD